MKGKKHSPEQIVKKLREADAMIAGGKTVGQVCQGLEISGRIKLVQVIDRPAPHFDGPKSKDGGLIKPGYCKYPGMCDRYPPESRKKICPRSKCPQKPGTPAPPDGFIDAPGGGGGYFDDYEITICAVCESGGDETILGCVNFKGDVGGKDDPGHGFSWSGPLQQELSGVEGAPCFGPWGPYPFPSQQPGPDWDEAEDNW